MTKDEKKKLAKSKQYRNELSDMRELNDLKGVFQDQKRTGGKGEKKSHGKKRKIGKKKFKR